MKPFRWSVRSKLAVSNAFVLTILWVLTFAGLRLLVFRLMDIGVSEELKLMANSVVAKPAKDAPKSKDVPHKDHAKTAIALPAPEYFVDSTQVKPTSRGVASRVSVRPTGNNKLRQIERDPNILEIFGRTDRSENYVIFVDETPQQSRSESTADPYKVYETPLLVNGNEVGIVSATYPRNEIERLQRSVDVAMRIVFPAGIILVAAFGWWSTGRALRPVKRITEAAAEVSGTNLAFRFPIGPDDEFSQLARSFNTMFERLQHSFDAQSRFVSDASHELKTPLSVVKANLEWMKTSSSLVQSTREPLTDALEASTRMQLLIDDLLCLAKADASIAEDPNTRSSISEVCADCVRTLLQRDPHLLIAVDVDEAHFARAKADHLRRILLNLIDNACRYGDEGKAVKVSSELRSGFVSVSIINQGEVIGPEVLARLGERFYRPDGSRARSTGGTGLGLAISKRLCELYGGTLSLSSNTESGTVAQLLLPAN